MLNEAGIQEFLLTVVGIAVAIVGVKIIFGSKKAQFSDTANTSINTLIGLVFVAIGFGTVAVLGLGSALVDQFFSVGGGGNNGAR
jgi:NADH:ubiquinone oxidoreductase subunit 2 (subunit N)